MKQDLTSYLSQPEKVLWRFEIYILGQDFLQVFQLQQKNNFHNKWSLVNQTVLGVLNTLLSNYTSTLEFNPFFQSILLNFRVWEDLVEKSIYLLKDKEIFFKSLSI